MEKSSTIGRADLRVQEPLRFVAANALRSVVAGILGAIVLVLFLRDTLPLWRGACWLALIVAVGALRLRLRARVQRGDAMPAEEERYLWHFTFYALVNGLVWASTPWVLSPGGDSTLQMVVLFACVAVATGGAFASLASLRTALAVFWPPMLAPALYGLFDGSRFFLIVGSTSLVLGLVLQRMLVALNRQFIEQFELRERNTALLLELRLRTADAEAANEAKSRFLVAAGHDLRQPMHAVAMRSRALLDQALPPAARILAGKLDQSVAALQGLFDALLDISRLDAGSVQSDITSLPLQPLFTHLADNYADVAAERAVTLHVDATPVWVRSDRLLLERILRQLLDNAMRHAAGQPVHLSASQMGDQVTIEVRDSGRGIPREQQQAIFKEFVQLENPQRDRRKGLGLGLAIVERLVRELGHRLSLESEPGDGACFRISMPAAESPGEVPPAGSTEATPTRSVAADLSNLIIALLDDDPDVLEAMSLLMSRWHCDVLAATSSVRLGELLRHSDRPPDLLICDYRLAEACNGRDVIDALRREYGAAIPALLISGDLQAIETASEAANITALRKPVRPAALREIIAARTGRNVPAATDSLLSTPGAAR
ncbi:MAG: ATP-binding protein [Tahibacter sp.]